MRACLPGVQSSEAGFQTLLFETCSGLKSFFPQIYIHPEPQTATLFGNKVFAGVIS